VIFDWDETKNAINLRKHGVRFETAALVFDDPFFLSKLDAEVDGEERWHTLGVAGGMLLIVVHTLEGEDHGEEVVRIISARKTEPHERSQYEEDL
jgi:hypothetical protein